MKQLMTFDFSGYQFLVYVNSYTSLIKSQCDCIFLSHILQ